MERTLISETPQRIGETVRINGWARRVRDHGSVQFIDMRDRSGMVQCVIVKPKKKISEESVLQITGVVKERDEKNVNPDLATGTIEIEVSDMEVLNPSAELPIPVQGSGFDLSEEVRIRYRYLDLRRDRMQEIMTMRSKLVQAIREVLFSHDFREIETPLLTKGTMEGARNFIVPSRLNPRKFYALPQSPQQYKQLLMTAGVERYFQIAKCVRDEDLRADRGFEFTQLDLELSFTTEEEVFRVVQEAVVAGVTAAGGRVREGDFPVLSYAEVMEKFGSDKFDIRTDDEKKENILAFAWVNRYPKFKRVDRKEVADTLDSRSEWIFSHNPFSNPIPEHIPWLLAHEHIGEIIASQYDLVCNGYEVASGSIRAHRPEVLRATYEIMGYTDEEIEKNIGHMLEAFSLGTPPHGGCAPGIERLVMLIANVSSLKETVAFPMTSTGKTAVTDAPSPVPDEVLRTFGLKVVEEESNVVFERLKQLLSGKSLPFTILEHEPVKTSEEASKVRGTPMGMAPKAMVLKKKTGEFVMAVVPADRKLDMKKLESVIGGSVKLASPEEVERDLQVKVGAVPPFGGLFGMETYVDERLKDLEEVVFNAGRRDRSIRMKAKDFIIAADPVQAEHPSDIAQ